MPPGTDVRSVHIDVLLTNLARLYRPLDDGFVAEEVAPRLPVLKESDKYPIFDKGPWFGQGDDIDLDLVADRAATRRVDFTWSTDGYLAEKRALGFDISDRERSNADDQLRLEQNKQRLVLGRLALLRERRVARLLQDTSQTGGQLNSAMTAATAARWDAAATTYLSITTDIIAGVTAMRQRIGVRPNVIVIPAAVAEGMHKSQFFSSSNGPQVVYSGLPQNVPHYVDFPLLPPTLLGMRVLVGGAIRDSSAVGGTFTASEVWSEDVRLLYVSPSAAIEVPSVAYTFEARGRMTKRWRDPDESKEVDAFEAQNGVIDERVVGPEAGFTLTNALT